MYVILIYDVNVKRVSKMVKLCRQYLCWIQNSVFEGEISEAKLQELCNKIKGIIDTEKTVSSSSLTRWALAEQVHSGQRAYEYRQFSLAEVVNVVISLLFWPPRIQVQCSLTY